jgi:hypothetical protein
LWICCKKARWKGYNASDRYETGCGSLSFQSRNEFIIIKRKIL